MKPISKKLVVDELGHPKEVIISWQDYQEIEQMLGLDLDEAAREDLREARLDRMNGREDAFVDLDDI